MNATGVHRVAHALGVPAQDLPELLTEAQVEQAVAVVAEQQARSSSTYQQQQQQQQQQLLRRVGSSEQDLTQLDEASAAAAAARAAGRFTLLGFEAAGDPVASVRDVTA
jgi:tRNA A37 threonylcarbamoyladenosine modification protein TsaB